MARECAQIRLDIWNDPGFRGLSGNAQHLYFVLLTSPSLVSCGVADWRPGKLSALTGDGTAEAVRRAGAELRRGLFIVTDEESEEVLVRSCAAPDWVMHNSKRATAMATAAAGVVSRSLRAVVVHALRQRHVEAPGMAGFQSRKVAAMLDWESLDPAELVGCEAPGLAPVSDIGCDIGSDIGRDIGSDIGCDIGSDIGSDIGRDIACDIGSDIGCDIGSDIGWDIGCDIGSDIGWDIACDIETGAKNPTPTITTSLEVVPTSKEVGKNTPLTATPSGKSLHASTRENPDPGTAPEPTPTAEPQGFADWYANYPRKTGRGDARKAYTAARKRVPEHQLLDAVRRYAADPNLPEKNFIPHPARWLNDDRWDSEPEPARPTAPLSRRERQHEESRQVIAAACETGQLDALAAVRALAAGA